MEMESDACNEKDTKKLLISHDYGMRGAVWLWIS